MPSGGTGGGNPANQNADTSFDAQMQQYLAGGDFSDAFATALKSPSQGMYGNTQLSDLLNSSDLSSSGVNWDTANIDDYYNALSKYGSQIDPAMLGDLATHGGNAVASDGNGGNSAFIGGSLGLSPTDIANAEKANLAAGGAPAALQYDYTPDEQDGHEGGILGDATNAIGAAVGPIAEAAIVAGLAAAGGAGAGLATGTAAAGAGASLGGAAIAGAGAGALGTVGSDVIGGTPLTLGSVAKGSAIGALGGSVAYEAQPLTQALTQAGVPQPVSSGLIKSGTGAITGAVGGALDGQGAVAGAEGGAVNAATHAAAGTVEGSIFNSGSAFASGSATGDAPNPNLPQQAPSAPMSDDLDPIDPTGNYATDNGDGTVSGGGSGIQVGDPLSGVSNPGYDPLTTNFNGTNVGLTPNVNLGGTSSGNAGLLSSLAGLLSGSGGSANSALLAQLLGLGATGIGGALSSSAAKSAAGNFAGETKFAPYSVTTNNGTDSFNGTNATASLSPGEQQTANGLTGLTNQAATALGQGTAPTQTADFDSLQAEQLQAQQRLMANTQDNEFANGVLGSTAGQYQTQGALGAIGAQTAQDETQAQTMAGTQQQQQLAQLTAGLNGSNQINGAQTADLALGANIGGTASGANVSAYSPSLAANSNSNIGSLLQGLGNGATTNSGQANNTALQTYLAGLMSGG